MIANPSRSTLADSLRLLTGAVARGGIGRAKLLGTIRKTGRSLGG